MRRPALLALALPLVASTCGAGRPAATATTAAVRYTYLLLGTPAGTETVERRPDGTWEAHFAYADRGRGPDETIRWKLGAGSGPVELQVSGPDYLKKIGRAS